MKLLTSNLHLLLCQLTYQAERMGDTVYLMEFWVEGAIQKVKRKLVHRGTSAPEEVINNELEFERALTLFQYAGPTPCRPVREMHAEREQQRQHQRPQPRRRRQRCTDDAPPTDAGSKMFGFGVPWNTESDGELSTLLNKVLDLLQEMQAFNEGPDVPAPAANAAVDARMATYDVMPECQDRWGKADDEGAVAGDVAGQGKPVGEGWTVSKVDDLINAGRWGEELEVCVYECAALRKQSEILYSRQYTAHTVRDGAHVLVAYGEEEWVGVIQKFVSIAKKSEPELRPLRLALVNFFKYMEPIADEQLGTTVHRVQLVPPIAWNNEQYPVFLDSIDGKLAYTQRTVRVGDGMRTERLLCKFNKYSGIGRD